MECYKATYILVTIRLANLESTFFKFKLIVKIIINMSLIAKQKFCFFYLHFCIFVSVKIFYF